MTMRQFWNLDHSVSIPEDHLFMDHDFNILVVMLYRVMPCDSR